MRPADEWIPPPEPPEDDWQEVEGALVTWNEPKELVGEYRGFIEQDGKFGKQEKHKLQTSAGVVNFFAPSALSRLLENISLGQRVKIVYPGTYVTSKSGQQVKQFQVFVKREAA